MTAIYDAYKGKDAKGVPLDNARAVRRYFEPSLAALINKDRADCRASAATSDCLTGDPFIDAQDWDIADFRHRGRRHCARESGRHRQIYQSRQASHGALDLVKIKNDWRISRYYLAAGRDAESLRELYGH